MAHPFKHMAKGGQACAAARYADGGGVAGKLADDASDAKGDVEGAMRYGADEISNPSNTEKPSTYIARRRLKGDGAFDGIAPKVRGY